MNTDNQILIVEDDLNLGFLLTEHLEQEGFQVKLCRDGLSGIQYFKKNKVDLCILDVMMPKMDGYSVARKIKEINGQTPFLFLTAKSLKEDKMKGYSLGADDYITKPFDEDELICKIRVALRRREKKINGKELPEKFLIGKYSFDYSRQELSFESKIKRLTEKESEVLRLLCLNKNRILRREEAVEQIYGKPDYFLGRSFDVFICRLRKMLSEDPDIEIENVFKVGFILNIKE